LNCILAQRLVRIVCQHCKKSVHYSADVLRASGLDPGAWGNVGFAEGAGCLECSGTGYHGRTAIAELLDLSDSIREMIINRRPTSEIKRAAREEGMTFLRDSGLERVREGVTTLKEINKVTFIE
jgi:type IV pilus assembly protein PilB